MDERSDTPSPADLAGEVGMLVVGLTTLTIQIFPFALPLLILVIGPLAVLALAGLLLALPILVPLWLARRLTAALRRRRDTRPVVPRHDHPIKTTAEPAQGRARAGDGVAAPPRLTRASAGAADGRRASGREARQPRAGG
jgi:hypothetical protein